MRLEYQIMAAMALDAVAGDPRWLPHPVRFMGATARWAERMSRKVFVNEYVAGAVAAVTVVGVTGCVAFALVRSAGAVHPMAADVVSILMLYTCLAARDLARHSGRVHGALERGDLVEARKMAAMMVGRDTENLNESDTARAAVESVAENTVDGVTAPLFFAVLAGPVGAMLYKAVNTLDSTFGYKNERYVKFGFVSAKLDDVVNYIPARLTAALALVAAAFLGMNAVRSARILMRDGRKHPSPNSGLCEAAMAGALGVQFGGVNHYFGKASEKPTIGDPVEKLERRHIRRANALMAATSILCAAVFMGARLLAVKFIGGL